ncbi:hypothetical protein [Thiovibrio frasassiensis]|uniref:DUF676 domain-containing protein n=1 Tax=Thiovibrio frasassiensis TaxID=2984131 RepID=A0A9X4MFP4_9BACT|nr:hypothetical protein [Thiovibrio frasassiensis]MDG4475797.1 hypothetical protein [Thiovibrio frasassiensis]
MNRPKQAVVVIHGIGEQRPMETLRSFVEAVLPETLKSAQKKYRSKPDQMSESFELRCLQAPKDREAHRPITEFYEYYWAHHMRDSKYGSVFSWLGGLLLRRPWKIPRKLLPIYFVTYSGLLLAAAILIWGLFDQTSQSLMARFTVLYEKKQLYFALAVLVLQAIGSRFLLGYVADAARYLTPSPDNIDERNKIRAEGIKLLRALHKSEKYFRIIVVGHSLGSVIGYDMIRHLWMELRESHNPCPKKQPEALGFDGVAAQLQHGTPTVDSSEVEAFQQKQHELWREHREVGIPWLVTDFITVGSPLTHATLLMAEDPQSFEQRKIEFEFPCCPPASSEETHYQKNYESPEYSHPVSVRIPNHGAPFASTRWTNLFFPYRMGILGDLIGGPLAGSFGRGIRDVPVRSGHGGFLRKTLYSHVCYWKPPEEGAEKEEEHGPESNSLTALQAAMRLESLRSKEVWPEPTPLRPKGS